MEYKGEQFEYDEIGNPTIYRGQSLTWSHGRQLDAYGDIASYTYNASGIRIGKTVGSTTTQYFLGGTKILAQKDTVNASGTPVQTLMQFMYGIDGVIGFTLNGLNYYYKKNLQNDIVGIYDNNLQIIAKYDYDAWGNHKISYLDNGNFVDFDPTNSYNESNTSLYIALKNPFRYRSYYYDFETGLYYLNSRYYDPEIGRFINIDDIEILDTTKGFANGINLFAYCLNNPINDADSNGNMPNWLKWLLGGLAFIGAIVLTVVSGGSLAPVFIGMGASILGSGLIQGVIIASSGGSFWSGFASGAADGAMWGGIFAFAGAAVNAIKYFATTTKLYRAVSNTEYYLVKQTGRFSTTFGHMEGKFFATTKANANLWKSQMHADKIIKIRILKKGLTSEAVKFFDRLDNIGPAYYFYDMEYLNSIIKLIKFL